MSELTGKNQFEAICCLISVRKLLATEVLAAPDKYELFRYASFTEILVNLNYLVQLSIRLFDKRITFKDDITITDKVKDISDLIRDFRNAAVHSGSDLRYFGEKSHPHGQKSFFGHIVGLGESEIDPQCSSEYSDDTAYFTGTQRIYLNRHIKRAYSELLELYRAYLSKHVMRLIEGGY